MFYLPVKTYMAPRKLSKLEDTTSTLSISQPIRERKLQPGGVVTNTRSHTKAHTATSGCT